MAVNDLTAARLRELLSYDPETGLFRWKINQRPERAKDPAGTINKRLGYVVIQVGGKLRYAHRLAWLYCTGAWPAGSIDHINGDKADNRRANLRDVSHAVNCANQHRAQGRAGMLGAVWTERTKNWRGVITRDDKQVHLGYFATPEEAHAAYLEAKRRLHEGCTI